MRSWLQCWKRLNDLLSRTDRCRNRRHIVWRGSLAATIVSKSSWLKKTKISLNLKTRCSIWAPVLIFSLFQAPWRCQLKKTIVSESHYYILRRFGFFLIPCTNETFTIMCNTHRITKSLQHTEDLRWALKRSGDLLLMSFTATPVSLHWQRQIYGWEQQAAQPSVMHTLTDPLNVIYSLCYSRQNIRISKMQTQTTAEERVWELHKVVMVIVMLLRPLNKTKSSSYRKPDYYQKLSFWLEA